MNLALLNKFWPFWNVLGLFGLYLAFLSSIWPFWAVFGLFGLISGTFDQHLALFPPDSRITNEDEARAIQASSLETFRRIAQAQAERERFLPGAAGVLHGGINAAASVAAHGLAGTPASDLMRLAVPVRDPDNGDAISGSGKFPSNITKPCRIWYQLTGLFSYYPNAFWE